MKGNLAVKNSVQKHKQLNQQN